MELDDRRVGKYESQKLSAAAYMTGMLRKMSAKGHKATFWGRAPHVRFTWKADVPDR